MALILPRRKAGAVDISTVFSTDLYTGNGSTQTITNGVDLSGEGGLVWTRRRNVVSDHVLFDTNRGVNQRLFSHLTSAQSTASSGLTAFNTDGFTLGTDLNVNQSGAPIVAWTFRKSPSFFDVVTYTGDGTAGRTISHNLGVTPGMIIIKRTSSTSGWLTYHRSEGAGRFARLDLTNAFVSDTLSFNPGPTDAIFYPAVLNASGVDFVAYLFAHDTTDTGVIQCGSYTGNGSSTGPTVTLGWEPQWVIIKRADSSSDWYMFDSERGEGSGTTAQISANRNNAELGGMTVVDFTSTGFQIISSLSDYNLNFASYIYIAIRKEGV